MVVPMISGPEHYYFYSLNTSGKLTVIIQSEDIPEHDGYYFGQFICNVPCPRITNSCLNWKGQMT